MNQIPGWNIYNHALIPSNAPHMEPNTKALGNNDIWKSGIFLVRYTTDFDCEYETDWWWLIKDDEIEIDKLKKKRRYEITKGLNNCDVRIISPKKYADPIYAVYLAAVKNYENAVQAFSKSDFITQCTEHESHTQIEYYGVFDKESGNLAGYALNHVSDEYVNFTAMKFDPKYLSKNVSAALVYTMLYEYLNNQKKKYVNDGERSIRHITNFQNYLIKYFGFRKAYCKLHVVYRPTIGIVVKTLFPFRKLIKKFDVNRWTHDIVAILDMEEIRRSF